MRRSVLIYGLNDPAYLPLLRSIGRDFDLALLPAALLESVREAGIQASDALAVLDADALGRIEATRAELVRRLAGLGATLAARFAVGDRLLWPDLQRPFVQVLLAAARQTAAIAAVMESLAATRSLAAVVLGFDTLPGGRAAAATGRRLGIPTIHVPHAVLARPRVPLPWQGTRVFADRVCAPGEFSRAGYLAGGAPEEAVVLTGAPRWDAYVGIDDAARSRHRAEVARALRLDPAAPIVVFGPSWIERSTANSCRHVAAALAVYRAVLAAVRARTESGVQLVVKLHPGEFTRPGINPEQLVAGWVGVARRNGVRRVAVTAGYKEALLAAADVVVSVNSNLGLEAMLCGRPVVNVPLLVEEARALFDPGTGVLALDDPAETTAALCALLDDGGLRARLTGEAPHAVRRWVHAPDGRAGERVARLVGELARAA